MSFVLDGHGVKLLFVGWDSAAKKKVKAKAAKKKGVKRPKKTLEDLDAEMAVGSTLTLGLFLIRRLITLFIFYRIILIKVGPPLLPSPNCEIPRFG